MPKYTDILIEKDDLAIDGDGQARIIEDRDVVLQDIYHAIRESGILVRIIAERSAELRRLLVNELTLLVEEDARIVPGSVKLEGDGDPWWLTADTYEFGKLRSPVWKENK